MVIEHIFGGIDLVLNKARRGSVKTSQVITAVKSAAQDFYNSELDAYRAAAIIPSSLRKFVKTVSVSITSGEGPLPSDFAKEITFVTDCGSEGDLLSPGAFNDRKKSFIIPPTEDHPIAKVQDGKIIVDPDETDLLDLTYFRTLSDPPFVYATTTDGDGRGKTFNSGASTDIEIGIEYSGEIIKRALVYLGVANQNKDAAEFGLTGK